MPSWNLSRWREGAKLSAVTTHIPARIPGAAHYPGSLLHAPARRRLRRFVAVVLASSLAACGHAPVRTHAQSHVVSPHAWPTVTPADPAAANAVLMRALGLVGTPYRYGGNTPEGGFDCSGLVTYVYRDMLDLRLPRTSRELASAHGQHVDGDRLAAAGTLAVTVRLNQTGFVRPVVERFTKGGTERLVLVEIEHQEFIST